MKVLILTCNTGEGHNSSAAAIKEEFDLRGTACDTQDSLAFLSEKMSEFISGWHILIYRHIPKLFGTGYALAESMSSLGNSDERNWLSRALGRGWERLGSFIESGGYDCVICVHCFSAIMLTELLRQRPSSLLTAFVGTDYTCSPTTEDSSLGLYFIPASDLACEFSANGIPGEKIVASGLPVRRAYLQRGDKAAAKRALGIPDDSMHVLMMCGSMGCGPIEALAEILSAKLPQNTVITAACGTNEKLLRSFEKLGLANVKAIGFTTDVPSLMDSADIFLTKPGGISITEAGSKGLPMILIDAVGGCEAKNMDYFLSRGLASTAADSELLAARCISMLADSGELKRDSDLLIKTFGGSAAEIICDTLEERFNDKRL